MNNVIRILEQAGQSADFMFSDEVSQAEFLRRADMTQDVLSALAAHDQDGLGQLLGIRTNMICAVFPADDEEDDDKDDEETDEDTEEGGDRH